MSLKKRISIFFVLLLSSNAAHSACYSSSIPSQYTAYAEYSVTYYGCILYGGSNYVEGIYNKCTITTPIFYFSNLDGTNENVYKTSAECSANDFPPPDLCTNETDTIMLSGTGRSTGSTCFNSCNYDSSGVSIYLPYDNTFYGEFTGTGVSCTLPPETTEPVPVPPQEDPEKADCQLINGVQYCAATAVPEDGEQVCSTIDDVRICKTSNDNCGTIDGVEACFDQDKNCGLVNGETICIEPPEGNIIGPQNSAPTSCMTNSAGDELCISNTSKESTATNTETNPDGSTTTTATTSNNIQGSGTSTKTTETSADGMSSTETTSITGDGGTTEGTEGEADSSVFTKTACTSTPVCEGDAILCSIAISQFKERCDSEALVNGTFDESIIQQNILGADSEAAAALDTPEEFGLGLLDLTKFNFGSTCPAPVTVSVFRGSSMTIDYDAFCSLASIIGVLILLTSGVISTRILAGV